MRNLFTSLVIGLEARIYDVEETTTGFGIDVRAFLEPFFCRSVWIITRAR